jgi:hypothetical protein
MSTAETHLVGGLAETEPAVTCGLTELFSPVTVDETLGEYYYAFHLFSC